MIILGGVQGTNRRFAPNAEQTLTLRSGDGSAIPSGISQTLYRVPERPAFVGQLRGLAEFRYLADAASITECHSGVQLPVAGDSAFLELERVYAASGVAGGEPLLVRVTARIEQRPAMEGDDQVETVVVDSVAAAEVDVPCGTIALRAALSAGPWSLVQLDGADVPAAVTGGEVPTIEWRAEGPTVGGSAGCNRYTGRGTLRGAYLVPAPLAMTRRMCVEESAMQREARFGTLISEGGWFAIIDDTLRFAQGPYVKARFVRR
jgi:heat shock protein HslJ